MLLKENKIKLFLTLVDCAPGTFYDDRLKKCTPCPIGSYQNDYAQVQCKQCPSIAGKQGVTSVAGARSVAECKGMGSSY